MTTSGWNEAAARRDEQRQDDGWNHEREDPVNALILRPIAAHRHERQRDDGRADYPRNAR
jgi:hypothetical protein